MKQAQQLLNLLEKVNNRTEIRKVVDEEVESEIKPLLAKKNVVKKRTLSSAFKRALKSVTKRLFGDDWSIETDVKSSKEENNIVAGSFSPLVKEGNPLQLKITLRVPDALMEIIQGGSDIALKALMPMVKTTMFHEFIHADQFVSAFQGEFGDNASPEDFVATANNKDNLKKLKNLVKRTDQKPTKETLQANPTTLYLAQPAEIDAFATEAAKDFAELLRRGFKQANVDLSSLNDDLKDIVKAGKLKNLDDFVNNGLSNDSVLFGFLPRVLPGSFRQYFTAFSPKVTSDPNKNEVWREFLKKFSKFLLEIKEEGKLNREANHLKPPEGFNINVKKSA